MIFPNMSHLCRGLAEETSVSIDSNPSVCPNICYRPIKASDLERLEQIHRDVFPFRYESEFFQNVVNGRDIVSWAAVDRSRPGDQGDELIGFATARIVLAKESEIADLIRYDSSKGEEKLVYILTLGVEEAYRRLNIATSLINEVIKYASSVPTCCGVYLHVISHNKPAVRLYEKMSFRRLRRLQGFYFFEGRRYDAYLFVNFINSARSCSPLGLLMVALSDMRSGIRLVVSKLTRN